VGLSAGRLERVCKQIRENVAREPEEGIDAYLARTWQMTLEQVLAETEPLPLVQERDERSRRLLERQQQIGEVD